MKLELKTEGEQPPINQEIQRKLGEFAGVVKALEEKAGSTEKALKDIVRQDEIKRINDALDELKSSINNEIASLKRLPRGGEGKTEAPELVEYKAAFIDYLRNGGRAAEALVEEKARIAVEKKAMLVQSEPDGGYAVLPQVEQAIDATVRDISPLRAAATVVQIGTDRLRRPFNVHGTNSGWVAEAGSRPETTSSQLAMGEFPVFDLYAAPTATQTMLDDAFFNVEQFIADEVSLEFAVREGAAFINGDGATKPRGLLTYTTADDAGAGVSWGSVGRINTGASGAFKTRSGDVNPADDLIALQYRLKPPYRANSAYMMNKLVLGAVRIMKDGQGNFVGGHRLTDNGIVDIIFGRPVVEAEDMPNLAANSLSIAFGDFRAAYIVVDRVGIRVLRDPYTAKPFVSFYTTKRVGGGVKNFEAFKVLRFGT